MIVSNESILMQIMINEGVEIQTIKKIRRIFKGWRIYFRGKDIDKLDIAEDYINMIKSGYTRKQAIKILSDIYEKKEGTIKEILSSQGILNEV